MRQLKYDVGDNVLISGVIKEIHVDAMGEAVFFVDIGVAGRNYGNGQFTVTEKNISKNPAYEQGIEEGRKQALTEIKALKEQMHKERMEKDFSHQPEKNTYSDDWRKLP